jgi:hypothetical protein
MGIKPNGSSNLDFSDDLAHLNESISSYRIPKIRESMEIVYFGKRHFLLIWWSRSIDNGRESLAWPYNLA